MLFKFIFDVIQFFIFSILIDNLKAFCKISCTLKTVASFTFNGVFQQQ